MGRATWAEVRARRLARSSLAGRVDAERLVDVVHDLGGVHAQVQASAELQIAARIDGIIQGAVREALWERKLLVKAWTLRGTLHLHPANELALWFAARRAVAGTSSDDADELEAWRDPEGVLHPPLGPDAVREIRAAVWDALDGRCLLRTELAEDVVRRVGPKAQTAAPLGFRVLPFRALPGPAAGSEGHLRSARSMDRRLARDR